MESVLLFLVVLELMVIIVMLWAIDKTLTYSADLNEQKANNFPDIKR